MPLTSCKGAKTFYTFSGTVNCGIANPRRRITNYHRAYGCTNKRTKYKNRSSSSHCQYQFVRTTSSFKLNAKYIILKDFAQLPLIFFSDLLHLINDQSAALYSLICMEFCKSYVIEHEKYIFLS